MSRKPKIHKHLPHTFDEVLIAVASTKFDEKKRKQSFKTKKLRQKSGVNDFISSLAFFARVTMYIIP